MKNIIGADAVKLAGLQGEKPAPKFPNILEFAGTVKIPATTGKFVAKDRFVISAKCNAPVNISYFSDNFRSWFGEKVEDPISEQILCYSKLCKASVDSHIIEELGAEKSETMLSEMFFLMEKQKNGEFGALLNDGCANIFYINDQDGVLRTVFVCWNGYIWHVDALFAKDSCRWCDGGHVFFPFYSRNLRLRRKPDPLSFGHFNPRFA